jgi:response regulator RpfG family c-di-GMP phosphodiesterase
VSIGLVHLADWEAWSLLGVLLWILGSIPVAMVVGRMIFFSSGRRSPTSPSDRTTAPSLRPGAGASIGAAAAFAVRRRVLLVDDDPALRSLLRTTLAADGFEVEEAGSAEQAAQIVCFWQPDVVVLDVGLPATDGLTFCRELKRSPSNEDVAVILLTGADTTEEEARAAGADALLRKPFSPLELVGRLERFAGERAETFAYAPPQASTGQLMLYARDLSRLLEIERAQRRLLQQAYRQTTTALADALEAKDRRTGLHALRVQRYALELTSAFDRSLLDDPSLEHGFLLHDIGKIAIPNRILNKPGPLTDKELEVVHEHPLIGEQILRDVSFLHGEALRIVRSHHERWDGTGYPDRLAENAIPVGARIFAVADALDAITTDRPYRDALTWREAIDEILAHEGRQFDPRVISAFAIREPRLRQIYSELTMAFG